MLASSDRTGKKMNIIKFREGGDMFTGHLKLFFRDTAVLTVFLTIIIVLMVIGLEDAKAAKPLPASSLCSISPVAGSTTADVPITFSASVDCGLKGGKP
jgi:hypothetical protein